MEGNDSMKDTNSDKTNRSVFPDGSSLPEHKKAGTVSGVVKVHESVIASIIRKAACSVDGVVRLAGNALVDNIAEFVGSRKVMDRAISIEMGDNSVAVEVQVVLEYGCNVPEIAENIQNTVTEEITRITGMQVTRIDIVVMDLETVEEEENSDSE
jgi:uncharacterized alkaline shock family protein YloU